MEQQILIKFRNGEQTAFAVSGYEDFTRLVEEMAKLWGTWMYVGCDAAVRKSDVVSMYYLPEGYDKRQRYIA